MIETLLPCGCKIRTAITHRNGCTLVEREFCPRCSAGRMLHGEAVVRTILDAARGTRTTRAAADAASSRYGAHFLEQLEILPALGREIGGMLTC